VNQCDGEEETADPSITCGIFAAIKTCLSSYLMYVTNSRAKITLADIIGPHITTEFHTFPHVQNSTALFPNLSQINPIYIIHFYYFNNHNLLKH
jgi:hypothetical protein